MFDYLEKEIGAQIHREAMVAHFFQHPFFLCHGDGLGKSSALFRIMRAAFHSSFLQMLFAKLVHPNAALRFGNAWSHHNRYAKDLQHNFRGNNEPVAQFAIQNYRDTQIPWITQNTYVALDEKQIVLLQFKGSGQPPRELARFLF